MSSYELCKKDLMLHTGCGFVSSSVKPSGFAKVKKRLLLIATIAILIFFLLVAE